jgi:hypothetical protein
VGWGAHFLLWLCSHLGIFSVWCDCFKVLTEASFLPLKCSSLIFPSALTLRPNGALIAVLGFGAFVFGTPSPCAHLQLSFLEGERTSLPPDPGLLGKTGFLCDFSAQGPLWKEP